MDHTHLLGAFLPIADGTVRQALFNITCTTCHVRLAVRSAEAIGAILECPKCGCMVPVTPPPGWQPPQPKPPQTPAAGILPDATSASPSGGPADNPPSCEPQGGATISTAEGDSTVTAASPGLEIKPLRFWHSWQFIFGAPISAAAIAAVVWLTMFSRVALDNSATRTPALANAASAEAAAEQNEKKLPSSEQTAAADKNDSTPGTSPANDESAEKSVAKPAEEKSAEAKPQSGPETPQAKTPDLKEPEQNATHAETSRATAASGETNQPAPIESRQNEQNKQSLPPATGAARMVKLVVPDVIDVQSRLGEMIPAIELRDMPFAQAVGLLAGLSGLPITIDPEAVARLGISLRDPISIRMRGATLEEVLQAIVARQGMTFTAEDGRVMVTDQAEDREKIRRIRYTVSDLISGDNAAAEQLANLVQKLIAPQSWRSAGGEGTIETDKTALIVAQTPAVHDQILVFCEKLRNARGRPLRSNRDPKRFDLATRFEQAAPALGRPVTANFHEPTKLVEILSYLAQQAEIDILIDRQALAAAGLSDKSEISFVAENHALAAALGDLLGPLKLGYRPIDARTLQVSTQSALDARLELEFYPVGKILGKELSGSDLVGQIKAAVFPTSWTEAGPATMYFDQPSAALIVLQSPPVHFSIRAYLDKLAENAK